MIGNCVLNKKLCEVKNIKFYKKLENDLSYNIPVIFLLKYVFTNKLKSYSISHIRWRKKYPHTFACSVKVLFLLFVCYQI